MKITDQILEDMKSAMKSGQKHVVEALRTIRAALKNAEIDLGHALDDSEAMQVLQKEAKKRREAAEEYKAAGREDLAENELNELKIIEKYLPAQLTPEEIQQEIDVVFDELKPASPKDMGRVMGSLMKKLKGRADGKLVQQLVQERFKNLS
jgi:hypothetical protein